ncbi:hypothetical protein BOTBODRAFT_56718 [Botryobasidium botryosum FD-172 SS1]|uniref:MARVEL domain-containing protein n=1 Tax=Botryobasidium botryosum (strain FD-172 SS1) TaxID=930990 RepID=A0A067M9J0_BOTB1|nr:hypothetical protein BOTBODRAFT_56718 [Botryobasidium botryosum FD-172 SS1]
MFWFQIARYASMSLLVLFNGIICSVAAWNFELFSDRGLYIPVDVLLIFVGGLAVITILPVLAVDIMRTGATTSHVWFELVWVGVFWILELSGASALTAMTPTLLCNPTATATYLPSTCMSTRALLAFTWLSTILLSVHLAMLLISALAHNGTHPHVWYTGVSDFPWFAHTTSSSTAPQTWTGRQKLGSLEDMPSTTPAGAVAPPPAWTTWNSERPSQPQPARYEPPRPPPVAYVPHPYANTHAAVSSSDLHGGQGLRSAIERVGPRISPETAPTQRFSFSQRRLPPPDSYDDTQPFYPFPFAQSSSSLQHLPTRTEESMSTVENLGVVTAMGMMSGQAALTPAQRLVEETRQRDAGAPKTSKVVQPRSKRNPGRSLERDRRPPPLDLSLTARRQR